MHGTRWSSCRVPGWLAGAAAVGAGWLAWFGRRALPCRHLPGAAARLPCTDVVVGAPHECALPLSVSCR